LSTYLMNNHGNCEPLLGKTIGREKPRRRFSSALDNAG
jgi:hypothetical protein